MAKGLKGGDKVEWRASQGMVKGEVKSKVTGETHIKGHKVAATPEHPEYIVVSDRTGALAAHKAESLHKRRG